MRIGSRNFPYPILNANQDLTSYLESSKFGFEFETTTGGEIIVENGKINFKNMCFVLKNEELRNLYEGGKVDAALIVECSSSTYRKSFSIGLTPSDLYIETKDLNGTVNISAYMYAKVDIKDYSNIEFNEIYQGYNFDIDKFDILAVDDGGRFTVNIDQTEDDKVSSIFTIVKVENDEQLIAYESRSTQIVIQLPKNYYEQYQKIKRNSDYNNIAFAILAIPVLSSIFIELQSKYSGIEEIEEDFSWFRSICASYKQSVGTVLDWETFSNEQPYKLAQLLLNYASCKGIEYFGEMISGENVESGEEDE